MAPPGVPDFEQMVEHTAKLPLTQQPEVRADGLHADAGLILDVAFLHILVYSVIFDSG